MHLFKQCFGINSFADVMNSIYELSKASHRRSVCIISMSGYVSKVVLRTPNGPFIHRLSVQSEYVDLVK